MNLYLDIDDTLLIWLKSDLNEVSGPNPYGSGHTMWRPNYSLLQYVWESRHLFEDIVMWTGGGEMYARHWRDRLAPWIEYAIAKDSSIPRSDDVAVDDMWEHLELDNGGEVLSPNMFCERVDEAVFRHRGWLKG